GDDAPVQDSWLVAPADLDRDGATDLLVGSSVGEAQAVFGKKWFDPAAPQGRPTISSVSVGSGSATINFSAVGTFGGFPAASYTATCEAGGQASGTASGSASPITVKNLAGNIAYRCYVVASNGGYTSAASASTSVIPKTARKYSLGPVLMLLLD
ncbi:MAG: hypothetical protein HY777_08985, partial [Betaproteobacteria bacterium]|nr:hypothetical protein [Betaproteobacteria bacterium]